MRKRAGLEVVATPGRQRPTLCRAEAGERYCVPGAAKLEAIAASRCQRPTLRRAEAGERHCVPGAARLEAVAASRRQCLTLYYAKAGERRSRPAKGGDTGPAVVGWRTIGSADSGRARDPAAGAEAPRRAGFRFTRPSLRQSAFPSVSDRPARGGRAAGHPPHGARLTEVKRDFRARCRIGGPAALEVLVRQIGTDICHSAGVVLARASNWERRRLYCGRVNGRNDEDNAGDAAP